MKKESDLWKLLKKNTPEINWTRLESWAAPGVPDVIGYHDSCGLFMVELKLARTPKLVFSAHQILWHQTHQKRNFILVGQAEVASSSAQKPFKVKLYPSSAVLGLLSDHRETPCLALDDWAHIQRLLLDACSSQLAAPLDACRLLLVACRLSLNT